MPVLKSPVPAIRETVEISPIAGVIDMEEDPGLNPPVRPTPTACDKPVASVAGCRKILPRLFYRAES